MIAADTVVWSGAAVASGATLAFPGDAVAAVTVAPDVGAGVMGATDAFPGAADPGGFAGTRSSASANAPVGVVAVLGAGETDATGDTDAIWGIAADPDVFVVGEGGTAGAVVANAGNAKDPFVLEGSAGPIGVTPMRRYP